MSGVGPLHSQVVYRSMLCAFVLVAKCVYVGLSFSTRPDPAYIPLAAARLFHLPFATSCPAQRGKADVQSGLPADAASLRSVDRYAPRGPVSHRIV